jgi:hypothetical protein
MLGTLQPGICCFGTLTSVEAAREAAALVEVVWGWAAGWAAAARGAEGGCRADKGLQLVMEQEQCSRLHA